MNIANYNDFNQLAHEIKLLGKNIGFDQVGIATTNLKKEAARLKTWLALGYHGNMHYLERNLSLRENPLEFFPDAKSIICCRLNYPKSAGTENTIAAFASLQSYSVYMQELLKKYVAAIDSKFSITQNARVFAGNAPILEKALAASAGLGWYGKNSILNNHSSGSYFFLGEIFTNLELSADKPVPNRCGNCTKCIDHCPTKAIVSPYIIDAKRCISYLTIENKEAIPQELRPLIGTKIFGCDACQEACPWNRFASAKPNAHFSLQVFTETLAEMFLWSEAVFKEKTKNLPLSRINHECFLRNVAVALGNTKEALQNLEALKMRLNDPSSLVQEHVKWAIRRLVCESEI